MSTSICICDDHHIVSEGIEHFLSDEDESYTLHKTDTAKQCLATINNYHVDVLILDLNLPDMNGLELLKLIRQQQPELPVLILTMHNDPFILERAKKLGANGYMLKDFGKNELLQALTSIRQQKFYKSPGIKHTAGNDQLSGVYHLTDREVEIIRNTATGKTAREIADKLYISPHTVNTHRRNIYKKLDLNSVNELINFAHKNGFT